MGHMRYSITTTYCDGSYEVQILLLHTVMSRDEIQDSEVLPLMESELLFAPVVK